MRLASFRVRRHCPDCNAVAQDTAEGWRCPWATDSRRRQGVATAGVIACKWPYGDMARRL